jgi:hypothetical protein
MGYAKKWRVSELRKLLGITRTRIYEHLYNLIKAGEADRYGPEFWLTPPLPQSQLDTLYRVTANLPAGDRKVTIEAKSGPKWKCVVNEKGVADFVLPLFDAVTVKEKRVRCRRFRFRDKSVCRPLFFWLFVLSIYCSSICGYSRS